MAKENRQRTGYAHKTRTSHFAPAKELGDVLDTPLGRLVETRGKVQVVQQWLGCSGGDGGREGGGGRGETRNDGGEQIRHQDMGISVGRGPGRGDLAALVDLGHGAGVFDVL